MSIKQRDSALGWKCNIEQDGYSMFLNEDTAFTIQQVLCLRKVPGCAILKRRVTKGNSACRRLNNQRQGSGSQLRNLRLRWDSSSKQIISFPVLTSSFSATTSHSIPAFLSLTTACDDLSLPTFHTIREHDTYYSSLNYLHQPRYLA